VGRTQGALSNGRIDPTACPDGVPHTAPKGVTVHDAFPLLSHPKKIKIKIKMLPLESSSTKRDEESGQEGREIADPAEGYGYGSQKAVNKVGDGIRFHSIIVGGSKSVRVGPLSSSFLWARDSRHSMSSADYN